MGTAAVWQALWGGVFDAFITAHGWTYTAQTGDGDPNTGTPGSAGTYPVFRVYSTTVSGETWYMRIDYGYTTNGPSLKVQLGSGVNGSGTLTGQTSTLQTLAFTSNELTTNKFYAISSATGRLSFMVGGVGTSSGGAMWYFVIHGGVDVTGAMSSGVDYLHNNANSDLTQNIPVSGTVPGTIATFPCNQSTLASNVIGSHTMTFHPFTWNEAGGNNPTPAMMIGGTTDFPTAGITVTATLYGSTRTFLATAQLSAVSSSLRTCILYE